VASSIHPSDHEYKTIRNAIADAYREHLRGGQVDFSAVVQENTEEMKRKLSHRADQLALEELGISKEEYFALRHSRRPQDRRRRKSLRRKLIAALISRLE
jgi:hypothetical protein